MAIILWRIVILVCIALSAGRGSAQSGDKVLRAADKLIVNPESYNIALRGKTAFKTYLRNNTDQDIANISLIPDSPAFRFSVSPNKLSISRDERAFFEVTMTPKPGVESGVYPVGIRLVGGKDRQLLKSFSLKTDYVAPAKKPAPGSSGKGTPEKSKAARAARRGQPEPRQPDIPAELPSAGEQHGEDPRVVTIRPTGSRPEIDGRLTDAAWAKAAVLAGFCTSSGGQAIYDTAVLAAFDDSCLYLGILCNDDDPELRSGDDWVEAVLSQSNPLLPSYALKVTALNSPTLQILQPDQDAAYWPAAGLSFAIDTAGRAWILEIAMPFSAFGALAPKTPEVWNMRINRNKAGNNAEQSFWPAPGAANSVKGMGAIRLQP